MDIAKLRRELMLAPMKSNFTFSRDEVMELLAASASEPAQILPGQVKNWAACSVCYGSGTDVAGEPCPIPACRTNQR